MTTVPDSGAAVAPEAPAHGTAGGRRALAATALGALGVVYGDIGTSPLYALKECFAPEYGLAPTASNVLGVLSLIFWSLNFVVSLKYLTFIMRGRQPGRGRHHGPARAAAAAAPARRGAAACLIGHRPVRRGAALRRRRHHAGDLGPRRRRGHRGRDAADPAVGGAHRVQCHPGGAVHVPAAWHGPGGRGVRAGHGGLVRVDRAPGRARDSAPSGGAGRRQSVARARFLPARWPAGVSHPGRRRAGRDRRRGAVRRHGPLRQAPDPARLVRRGAAGAGAQLLRPGRPPARSTRRRPRIRSTRSCRAGRCTRWSASPRRPRWSRRRP